MGTATGTHDNQIGAVSCCFARYAISRIVTTNNDRLHCEIVYLVSAGVLCKLLSHQLRGCGRTRVSHQRRRVGLAIKLDQLRFVGACQRETVPLRGARIGSQISWTNDLADSHKLQSRIWALCTSLLICAMTVPGLARPESLITTRYMHHHSSMHVAFYSASWESLLRPEK